MADIRKFAVQETSVLHLRDASDELMYADEEKKKPMTITLYGPGSKQYAKAKTKESNRMMDRLKKKGKSDQTAEEKAQEVAELLADCTKSFEHIEYDDLKGEELFKAVYADKSIGFIAEQVNKHLSDWANFTGGSAKK